MEEITTDINHGSTGSEIPIVAHGTTETLPTETTLNDLESKLVLAPDHRIDLKKSGLTDATIAAAGIAAIPPNDITKVIGYNIPEVISAYRIPFGNGFERIKVFYRAGAKPAPGKKLRKYHQKAGCGNRLYIPPTLDSSILNDTNINLFIVEGEKKTLKAIQEGFRSIGFTGVWNWKRKGTDELIYDFLKIKLKNRKVVIVPDSDWKTPGKNLKQAIERFARALQIAGAIVYIQDLPVEGDEKVGLDDYLVKHGAEAFSILTPKIFPVEAFCRVERDGMKLYETESIHILDINGKRTGKKYEIYKPPVKIADALEILAYVRSNENCEWGKQIRFQDPEGNIHKLVIASELMCRDGEAIRKELMSHGYYIHPSTKHRTVFNQFLLTTEPDERVFALCTGRTGWNDDCFVLPNQPIGDPEKPIIYQGSNKTVISSKGSLAEWIETISKLCAGNSRLVFGVSLAFAATLLEICSKENGGFHMRGKSSKGKSTIQRVACSVWGGPDYKLSWKGTINGHEANAEEHNDILIVLDEIAEADPKTLGNTAYMYANGQGKMRADKSGDAKKTKKFRLLLLSSGEISLAEVMRSEGKQVKAGQELRLCDIPADWGRYGAFDNIHGYENGSKFSDDLSESTKKNFGFAGVAFIEKLIPVRSNVPGIVKTFEEQFVNVLPPNSDGQVIRIANRFALIAAAGELATEWGITGWPQGEALKSIMTCFNDWLAARGGVTPFEIREALSQVRHFFANHGASRFTEWQFLQTPVNRAGFRRIEKDGDNYEYFVFPDVFIKEVCVGLDHKFVTSLLVERGILKPGKGSTTANIRLPEIGQARCYHITSKIFEVEI